MQLFDCLAQTHFCASEPPKSRGIVLRATAERPYPLQPAQIGSSVKAATLALPGCLSIL